ncbi:LAFE_0C00606g1_1 [Lachancea fermentati]|uniref:DNA mismatch repair protein MSH3 n=1 Tax=Lachancea fermentati TaxID=4955 RepID=A0A1G4M8X8_LACFM|nr:LAFE_0C00606g1_1 [Lachancea fermentati]
MSYQPTISKFFVTARKPSHSKFENSKSEETERQAKIPFHDLHEIETVAESDEPSTRLPSNSIPPQNFNHRFSSISKKMTDGHTVASAPSTRELQSIQANAIQLKPQDKGSQTFANKLQSILQKRDYGKMTPNKEFTQDDTSNEPASKKSKSSSKLTPLDQQVKDLKLANMDKILAIRVGYKYKFFAMDAVVVSKILQIMLIKGKLTLDDSNPDDHLYRQLAYCSIPDNRLEVHLQRLLHHNLKVGVVEQNETQAIKKSSGNTSGVFQRSVSKVFTRATYDVNETFQSGSETSSTGRSTIWALKCHQTRDEYHYWLLSVQLNTGEIIYDSFSEEKGLMIEFEKRVSYLNPIEIVTETPLPEKVLKLLSKYNHGINVNIREASLEDESVQVSPDALNFSFDLERVASVLRSYLKSYDTEQVMDLATNYHPFEEKSHMILSPNTLESLEIFENKTDKSERGSLFWLLDHTRTPFGSEKLKNWLSRPLVNEDYINERLDAVECIRKEIRKVFMEGLSTMLRETPDFLRILNRIYYGQTSRREVFFFLRHLDKIAKHFLAHRNYVEDEILSTQGGIFKSSKLLASIFCSLDNRLRNFDIPKLLNMINVVAVLDKDKEKQCIEFFNLNNYDNSEVIIKKLRDIQDIKDDLQKELERIRKTLNRPKFTFRDENEYLIEVRNSQISHLPKEWVKVNCTKALSRFRTPETTKLVEQLELQRNLLVIVTEDEYRKFLGRIKTDYENLRQIIDDLASFDCILSLAATSMNKNYTRPIFKKGKRFIKVKNGRNPIIECLDVNYVPNDVEMFEDNNKVMVITGPNMGGKSSYIRQVALTVILAQIGSFVPAERADLSVFDSVFTRIGAHDNILRGESTFMVEMLEMLEIVNKSKPNSLLLLDEVGRGTGTTDGVSISYAILKYFLDLESECPFILFITHYPILGEITSKLLENYHMSYIEERKPGENWPSVILLYELRRGPTHSSYGLNVARLANISTEIINRAYCISENFKNQMECGRGLHFVQEFKRIMLANQRNEEKVFKLLKLCNSQQSF